jgi:hypothetical protein
VNELNALARTTFTLRPDYRYVTVVVPDPPAAPAPPARQSDSLIDALAASGYGHPSVDDLKALANRGISPSFVQRMEAAGLRSLTVQDAIRLAENGVSPHDVSNALRILESPPSIDDIIRLHNSGVE